MSGRSSPFRTAVLLFGGALALTAAGLYGTARFWGNSSGGSCSASEAIAQRIAPLAKGEIAALQVDAAPRPAPAVTFDGPDGKRRGLEDFKGRTVLLNLWATWCEPCKREMPALDKLQAELGGPAFEVAAVNIDTRNLDRPKAWLAEAGITRLAYYADAKATIFQDLKRTGEVEGLPTTLLLGPDGCKIARLAGWAEWGSPDGMALFRAALPQRD
jgi:thiol-disulfide isomerase/thioredoxin